MALVEVSLSDIENKSAFGPPMPALRGPAAVHLSGTFTTSALMQQGGQTWVAPSDGYARVLADAKVYVRFAPAADATAAAQGAGWPLLADRPEVFSYRAGDSLRIAEA